MNKTEAIRMAAKIQQIHYDFEPANYDEKELAEIKHHLELMINEINESLGCRSWPKLISGLGTVQSK